MGVVLTHFHLFIHPHTHHNIYRENIKSLYRESLGTSSHATLSSSPSSIPHTSPPSIPPSLQALHPTADAHTYLAYLLSYEGAFEEAKEGVREAMKMDREFGNAWNDLGLVRREGGKEEGAGRRERGTKAM
jgi:tetratricopeptide (TPR) repeat protein